jgi:sec-independent protein translocase protein TatB
MEPGVRVFDIGPGEMITLLIIALFIFGPEKLPKMAAKAGRVSRQFHRLAQEAKDDLEKELGPPFTDVRLKDLNPRSFLRVDLLDDSDPGHGDPWVNGGPPVPRHREQRSPITPGERPPHDADAT